MLDIRMNVDEKEYMKEWRNRRVLTGAVYDLEKKFIYNVVIRKNDHVDKSSGHLTDVNGTPEESKYGERSMGRSGAIATLTASGDL